jgi:PAS domain S-box-containing protein
MPMVVSDPREPDNPIVLANQAFLEMSGYGRDEVLGRNCRFLQGPDTSPEAVAEIARKICAEEEVTVELLNYRKDGSSFWNNLFISPVHDDDGKLVYFFASQKDVTIEREERERKLSELRLMREVDHRAKNVLALVQGIVRMSRADSIVGYATAVQGRVEALARAHGLLSERRWRDVSLLTLVRAEVEPFGSRQITIDGPHVELPSSVVQPIALLIYELIANAAQHGALSVFGGRVSINWVEDASEGQLVIRWREEGGPPPAASRREGFGFTLMSGIVERQLQGSKKLGWNAEGLAGEFRIPISRRQ